MKILIVFSDAKCGCTLKCCFELSEAMKKYIDTDIIYYRDLDQESIENSHIVIFQRLGANNGPITIEDKTRILYLIEKYKNTKKFVYIIDDLVLEAQRGTPKFFLEHCHAVLCSSETLGRVLRKYNKNVFTFHTFIDCKLFDCIESSKYEKFTLVWASTGGLGEEIIRGILERKDELGFDFDLLVISKYANELKYDCVKRFELMPMEELIKVIKGTDILLNPMVLNEELKSRISIFSKEPVEDFINSKAEIKYAIAGITKACLLTTDQDSYKRVVKNGINGFTVTDNISQWIEKIRYIYENKEEVTQIKEYAYKHVMDKYDVNSVALDVINILKEIINI